MTIACPLCLSSETKQYFEDKNRRYEICKRCDLIFVSPEFHLNQADEKKIYDLHQNSPDDEGYRRFLNKLLTPLTQKLPQAASGLDFGCGPGPAIQPLLESQGYTVSNYDLYYYQDNTALNQQYDFITCTEAIEHFSQPRKELELLDELLKIEGYLGIMTKRPLSVEAFANWHYKNDPTHISFFSEATFHWIGDWLNYTVEFPSNDTAILHKLATP
ncbi:class I SAM-dependent methyltransferase [Kangiella marina]|uniref:Class I SAM-dependent methyltransferase n=1 Tax=Kangiella marina TaxID=1079178 RepID=A0ABP8IM11_9GAMM